MSGQQPQQQPRVRRNSPATTIKQGPMKATLPVAALMRPSSGIPPGSPPRGNSKKISPPLILPTNSSSDSPTNYARFDKRQSPDQRISPEWKVSGSPVLKDKSKPLTGKSSGYSTGFSPSCLSTVTGLSTGGSSAGTSSLSTSLSQGAPYIRRTSSLDTLYLASPPWPSRDSFYGSYCGRLMVDRATQTPEEWDEMDRRKGQQKKIADGLEMKFIRQRLQRSTQSRGSGASNSPVQSASSGISPQSSTHSRFSPVQASHQTTISAAVATSAYLSSCSPFLGHGTSPSSPSMSHHYHLHHPNHSVGSQLTSHSSAANNNQSGYSPISSSYSTHSGSTGITVASSALNPSANPIPIPHIPKPLIPRMRSSVEGLNQEIEKLVQRGISGNDSEGDSDRMRDPTPDGHRAPIAKLFRTSNMGSSTANVDTQTPSNVTCNASGTSDKHLWSLGVNGASLVLSPGEVESGGSSGATSRSHSVSPIVPLIPGSMDNSRPPSTDGRKSASPEELYPCEEKLGTSPQINKFLAREPPDGCEKIKLVDEHKQTCPLIVEPACGNPSVSLSAFAGLTLRPSVNFVLMPSQSSAFHPLYKTYLPPSVTSTNGPTGISTVTRVTSNSPLNDQ